MESRQLPEEKDVGVPMDNLSPSASSTVKGQVGVVNNEGGVTFNLNPRFELSGFVGGFLAPRKARKVAEATTTMNKAIAESMGLFMAISPTTSPERAYLMAVTGLMFTERQADNLFAVLSLVAESANEEMSSDRISDVARDKIIKGSREADEQEMREIWAKLVLGELESPGLYSKRSMDILANMTRRDAEDFQTLCSYCAYPLGKEGDVDSLLIVENIDDGSINDGAMSLRDRTNLESMGLVVTSIVSSLTIPAGEFDGLATKEGPVFIANDSDHERKITFSPVLTNEGKELSRLCEDSIGSLVSLQKQISIKAEKSGLRVKTLSEIVNIDINVTDIPH